MITGISSGREMLTMQILRSGDGGSRYVGDGSVIMFWGFGMCGISEKLMRARVK
jgi:acyl CoA:acetate/3-ketoacid CoA transferase alpha subunit